MTCGQVFEIEWVKEGMLCSYLTQETQVQVSNALKKHNINVSFSQ